MNARLLAQLGWVFQREADAIVDQYRWPPRGPLTVDEQDEVQHLEASARSIFGRAEELGQWTGTDYCFGDEAQKEGY